MISNLYLSSRDELEHVLVGTEEKLINSLFLDKRNLTRHKNKIVDRRMKNGKSWENQKNFLTLKLKIYMKNS